MKGKGIMKSAYQLDQEMMSAWLKWTKAQEKADRAKAEYDRAARAMKRHIEEHKAKTTTGNGSTLMEVKYNG